MLTLTMLNLNNKRYHELLRIFMLLLRSEILISFMMNLSNLHYIIFSTERYMTQFFNYYLDTETASFTFHVHKFCSCCCCCFPANKFPATEIRTPHVILFPYRILNNLNFLSIFFCMPFIFSPVVITSIVATLYMFYVSESLENGY